MMEGFQLDISAIAHVIQIAVAPVFLLAGIAGLLGVMTNRLGRVIDRARSLARGERLPHNSSEQALIDKENKNLLMRGRFINLAIVHAGTSALLVCFVIMALFVASLTGINFSKTVAVLFIICMALLIIALSLFLFEVLLATRHMRSGLAKTENLIHPDSDQQH